MLMKFEPDLIPPAPFSESETGEEDCNCVLGLASPADSEGDRGGGLWPLHAGQYRFTGERFHHIEKRRECFHANRQSLELPPTSGRRLKLPPMAETGRENINSRAPTAPVQNNRSPVGSVIQAVASGVAQTSAVISGRNKL